MDAEEFKNRLKHTREELIRIIVEEYDGGDWVSCDKFDITRYEDGDRNREWFYFYRDDDDKDPRVAAHYSLADMLAREDLFTYDDLASCVREIEQYA